MRRNLCAEKTSAMKLALSFKRSSNILIATPPLPARFIGINAIWSVGMNVASDKCFHACVVLGWEEISYFVSLSGDVFGRVARRTPCHVGLHPVLASPSITR